jgi:hypothetical protein
MIKRWHHGHSLGAGVLVGLGFATYREWLLLAFAFVLGIVVTLVVERTSRIAKWIGRSVSPLSMRKWRALRRRVNDLRPDDEFPAGY